MFFMPSSSVDCSSAASREELAALEQSTLEDGMKGIVVREK